MNSGSVVSRVASWFSTGPSYRLPILLLVMLVGWNPFRVRDDCAYFMQAGLLLLEGQVPYVDFIDINPPMIMYISAIPAAVSRIVELNPIPVFSLFVVACVAISTEMIRGLIMKSRLVSDPSEVGCFVLTWLAFNVLMYWRLDFGQREHLLTLFFIPFLVVRWIRGEGGAVTRLSACTAGILAAVGVLMKPQFLLLPFMSEIYWIVKRGSDYHLFDTELIAFLGTGVLYAVHFMFVPTAMREDLFFRWLPFVFEKYAAFEQPWKIVMMRKDFLFAAVAVLVPLLVPAGVFGRLWSLTGPLSVTALAGLFSFLLHRTGFSYQLIPAIGPACLILGLLVNECAKVLLFRKRDGKFDRLCSQKGFYVLFLVLLMVSGTAAGWLITAKGMNTMRSTEVRPVIEKFSHKGDRILILSPPVEDSYPVLLQTERKHASRYLVPFPVGWFYLNAGVNPAGDFPYREKGKIPREEALFLKELEDDVIRFRPVLIMIPHHEGCHGCPGGFNLLKYFTRNGFVTDTMRDYDLLTRTDRFTVFRLRK